MLFVLLVNITSGRICASYFLPYFTIFKFFLRAIQLQSLLLVLLYNEVFGALILFFLSFKHTHNPPFLSVVMATAEESYLLLKPVALWYH